MRVADLLNSAFMVVVFLIRLVASLYFSNEFDTFYGELHSRLDAPGCTAFNGAIEPNGGDCSMLSLVSRITSDAQAVSALLLSVTYLATLASYRP